MSLLFCSKNEVSAPKPSITVMRMTKTQLGSFDVLDFTAISAIYGLLDVDSQLRFTGSCLRMSRMFGQFAAATVKSYMMAASASRVCRTESAVLLRQIPPVYDRKCVEMIYQTGDPRLISLLPKDCDKNSAFHGACCGGWAKLAKSLITRDSDEWNFRFDVACRNKRVGVIKVMLLHCRYYTWLHAIFGYLCELGNVELIILALDVLKSVSSRDKGARGFMYLGPGREYDPNSQHIWDEGLKGACRGGHRDIAEMAIRGGTVNWDHGLDGACEGGHLELVEMMIALGATAWNIGMMSACKGGHRGIAEMMVKFGANMWNGGLSYACRSGNADLAEMMIGYGANDWDKGLCCACIGGQRETAEIMLRSGVVNCDTGLEYCARYGYCELAELLIRHGATDFGGAMRAACNGGQIEAVELMIRHGANNWDEGLRSACEGGHRELAEMMIRYGARDWNAGLIGACEGGFRDLGEFAVTCGARGPVEWAHSPRCTEMARELLAAVE